MKKALIIGIDNYPHAPLSCCVNDAKTIADLLEHNQDGSKNFDVKVETTVFTKSVLRSLLVELFSGHSESVLFYFSGHGCTNTIGGYLCTPDGKAYDEGIFMDEILKLASVSKARNKTIIIDCCHAGNMGSPAILGSETALIHDGVTIFTASKHDELAMAGKAQSLFTGLLIEALKGGGADINGRITPGSIYAFIDQALGPFDQRPVFKTNTTTFNPIRHVNAHVPVDVIRKLIDYFPTPGGEYKLDPSYEFTNVKDAVPLVKEPYANENHVVIFNHLQKLQSIGLVVPVDTPFMYFAAMNNKSCALTPLGQHYWRLAKTKRL